MQPGNCATQYASEFNTEKSRDLPVIAVSCYPSRLAAAEAASAFGDSRLLLEQFVEGARHIEFQVRQALGRACPWRVAYGWRLDSALYKYSISSP